MNYSITYLEDTTIITFSTGAVVVLDENLSEFSPRHSGQNWLLFTTEERNVYIHSNGSGQQWFCGGMLHRDDGPAVIYSNGEKHWFQHGDPIESK